MVCENSFAVKMFYRKGRGGGAKGNIYRIPNLKLPNPELRISTRGAF